MPKQKLTDTEKKASYFDEVVAYLELEDSKSTTATTVKNSIAGIKGEVKKANKKLEEEQKPVQEGLKERFTSRKFLIAVLTPFVILANEKWGVQLDIEELLALLIPLITWMLSEFFVDYKEKAANDSK